MRIPAGENLGNITRQAVQTRRSGASPSARADLGGTAQALSGLGAQVMQADQAFERRKEIAAEQDRVEIERQTRIREAADKASALSKMQDAQDALENQHLSLLDSIKTGETPKDKAIEDWGIVRKGVIESALKDVPAQFRETVSSDLNRSGSKLERQVGKAVTIRDQEDIRGSLKTIMESTQRQYMTDPVKAQSRLESSLESLGPYSGMGPDDIGNMRQGWMENTRLAKANLMINDARRSNKDLTQVESALQSEEFASLDPSRKVTLSSHIEGFKAQNDARAEAAARRAQAAQEHRLKVAESAVSAARMLTDQGKSLNEEATTQLIESVKGTPFAEVVPRMLREVSGQTAFGMRSLPEQQQALEAMRGDLVKNGTDPETEKRFNKLESIYKAKTDAFKSDPMQALVDYGLADNIPPVDMSSIPAAMKGLQERVGLVALAEAQMPKGSPAVSMARPEEAVQLANALGNLPLTEQAATLQQLTNTIGAKQSLALARQVAPKDKALSLAMQADSVATSELLLRGARAIQEKSVKEDNNVYSSPRVQITEQIGEAFPIPGMREDMIEAATLAVYGDMSTGGSGKVKKALKAVGINVANFNGAKIPLPKDMDEGDFEDRLATMGPQILEQSGGKPIMMDGMQVAPDVFAKQLPSAQLMYAGPGRYAVKTSSGIATDINRKPIIIRVK
jgi:hypothetical protein